MQVRRSKVTSSVKLRNTRYTIRNMHSIKSKVSLSDCATWKAPRGRLKLRRSSMLFLLTVHHWAVTPLLSFVPAYPTTLLEKRKCLHIRVTAPIYDVAVVVIGRKRTGNGRHGVRTLLNLSRFLTEDNPTLHAVCEEALAATPRNRTHETRKPPHRSTSCAISFISFLFGVSYFKAYVLALDY